MIVRTVAARGASRATRAAFTLMEIMVVVAIIVILASVSVVAVTRYLEQARVDTTRAKLATVEHAVQDYHNRTQDYPANLEVLCEPLGGLPAYLGRKDIVDEWNREFVIDPNQHSRTGRVLIYSMGPNPGDPSSQIRNFEAGD
jgi:general secretion pathway protein G